MLLRYAQARHQIRTGDLLLFRRRGILGWLIGIAGRSPYCHAGMAVWQHELGAFSRLYCVDMVGRGGRRVPLAQLLLQSAGRIDWFAADPRGRWPEFSREWAAGEMLGFVGRDYGWGTFLRIALLHLPIVRLLQQAPTDDRLAHGWALVCSQAVAAAYRAGGVDPVPLLADRVTEPADLARSTFFRYRGTLIP
jgi:hypothetical protein